MNAYQNLNNAMAAGTVAALLAGSFKPSIPPSEQPLTFWLFVAFLCLMRLKIHLDDKQYFETAETKSPHFKIGFIIAVISWMLWSYSAYSVGSLREALLRWHRDPCLDRLDCRGGDPGRRVS